KSVTDAYGHTSSTTYDHFGMPLIQRDINGIQFAYVYDPMRRIIQFKGPYSNEWTIRNEYKKVPNSDLRYAVTKHNIMDEIVTPGEQILHTSSFADGLGRIIQTKNNWLLKMIPTAPHLETVIVFLLQECRYMMNSDVLRKVIWGKRN